jgi:hypothetical protein
MKSGLLGLAAAALRPPRLWACPAWFFATSAGDIISFFCATPGFLDGMQLSDRKRDHDVDDHVQLSA